MNFISNRIVLHESQQTNCNLRWTLTSKKKPYTALRKHAGHILTVTICVYILLILNFIVSCMLLLCENCLNKLLYCQKIFSII